ncbi:MAG TPA: sigma-70 family RNA polymerase sigma factor [Gemmataceae bacterium]|nr:sigma-70 family RNA polymerase sigma factor [Gemmataceae bacterium]
MTWNELTKVVERARTGDRSAYGELVERFQTTVYALALARLRNPTEAQELVQEVFIHAMTKLSQLRDVNCFAGWLRQIAERMALNRLTRRGPLRGAEPAVLENVPASASSPLDELVLMEQKAQLWAGLDRLKPVDRATLVAFYIHGRSLKQMSREFETPIGTIKRRLHVARNRLRRHLDRGTQPGDTPPSRRTEVRRSREMVCA